ncbi:hypothetical protein ACHHYP_11384 [Achlya hypogyna]|uniref:CBM1 domain-containing protein n=1 Tax=Achlya hypogyna TaxID=1202772 RepID=A0A1V9YJ81_ACHHY|nr:hypothetical protein ACHHYP_11384 [Achlya hypogyna]
MQFRYLAFFLAAAAASEHHHHHRHHHAAAEGCTNVSVQGDATYCVTGNICGGNGDQCPKKGDVAVADCRDNLKSYTNGGKCVAPVDGQCQVIATGAKGCVFGPAPPTSPPATPAGCTNVSVEGDGTYCITGPVCSGTTGGGTCPKKGDPVVANCVSNIPSFVNGKCSAPKDATCQKLKTGAYGCTFAAKEVEQAMTAVDAALDHVAAVADEGMAATANEGCTNVSVQGDATYCINGPICSGTSGGGACPKKGDRAVASCVTRIPSYVNAGNCVAPTDATCRKLQTGAYGCAYWGLEVELEMAAAEAMVAADHAMAAAEAMAAPVEEVAAEAAQGCTNVSVEGDATYCVEGNVCGGNGDQCPKKGAVAVANCVAGIPSFANGKCALAQDATCGTVKSGAKGCILGRGTSPTVAPTVAPAPAGGNQQCAENWSQCNGQNWPFGVCCKNADWKCVKHNDYYSQCVPK